MAAADIADGADSRAPDFTKIPDPTRRLMLAGLAAAAAIGAGEALATAPDTAEIERLAAAYVAASALAEQLSAESDEAQEAFDEATRETPIPAGIGVRMDAYIGRAEIEKSTRESFETARLRLQMLGVVDRAAYEQAAAVLARKRDDMLAQIDAAFAEIEVERERYGVKAKLDAFEAADDAQQAALVALGAFRCTSTAQVAAKARALLKIAEEEYLPDAAVEALLRSFLPEVA